MGRCTGVFGKSGYLDIVGRNLYALGKAYGRRNRTGRNAVLHLRQRGGAVRVRQRRRVGRRSRWPTRSTGSSTRPGDNAILLFHALTGSHHAAGYNPSVPGTGGRWTEEMHVGWWDSFIGPGRSRQHRQVRGRLRQLGGALLRVHRACQHRPRDRRALRTVLPAVSVGDTVRAHFRLLDHLGVKRLHAVVGGSVGGHDVPGGRHPLPRPTGCASWSP